jgi:SCF-associated factor 1
VQVSSGWSCSAVLTRSGDVLVWFPRAAGFGDATGLSAAVEAANRRMDDERDKNPMLIGGSHDVPPRIPCHVWEIEYDPIKLNPLPDDLPRLDMAASGEEEEEEPVKLIKIAAMENNMVGLTNRGHVLLYDDLGGESTVSTGHWKYVDPSLVLMPSLGSRKLTIVPFCSYLTSASWRR